MTLTGASVITKLALTWLLLRLAHSLDRCAEALLGLAERWMAEVEDENGTTAW